MSYQDNVRKLLQDRLLASYEKEASVVSRHEQVDQIKAASPMGDMDQEALIDALCIVHNYRNNNGGTG